MGVLGELTVAVHGGSMRAVEEFVGGHAGALGYTEKRVGEICSAVVEAVENIKEYAYGGRGGNVHISCKQDQGGRLVITIADDAEPLNVLLTDDPWPSPGSGKGTSKGPSTTLMKRYAGNIEYRRMDNQNILTFAIAGVFPSQQ